MTGNFDVAIAEALATVCDPCSLASNAPLSIVDMGLVREWQVDGDGNVLIRMCVTSPCCTMAPNIVRGATEAISAAPGVRSVKIDIDASLAWRPEWMTVRGKAMLARRRDMSLRQSGVRPQQWRKAKTDREEAGV